jgi:hypothetical protein
MSRDHEDRELLERILQEEERIERTEERIEAQITPRLASIKIAFTVTKGVPPMSSPVAGPVVLTTAGQQAIASILGFDQLGNPWTGTIPPVSYSIDNPAVATSTPNSDDLTDVVTAVANGVANLSAGLTTAEGTALSDVETVTVNIPVVPPPTPVLSSIKIAFAV